MESPSAAALQHIEIMKTRIDRQTALIVELQEAGQDTLYQLTEFVTRRGIHEIDLM
jgi:hypothetical protein